LEPEQNLVAISSHVLGRDMNN